MTAPSSTRGRVLWALCQGHVGVAVSRRVAKGLSPATVELGASTRCRLPGRCVFSRRAFSRRSVTSTKNSVDEFCGLLCQRSRGTYCGRCNGESIQQQGYAISWRYILMSGAFNSLSAQACKFRLRRQTFAAPATLTPRQVHPLLCSTKLLPITPIWL